MRHHALLAALLGSTLRISEVLPLDIGQYTGRGCACVQVRGGQLRDSVPVQRDARAVLLEASMDTAAPQS